MYYKMNMFKLNVHSVISRTLVHVVKSLSERDYVKYMYSQPSSSIRFIGSCKTIWFAWPFKVGILSNIFL